MGADISVEAVAGKLNRVGYEAFIMALRQAKTAGNRNIDHFRRFLPGLATAREIADAIFLYLGEEYDWDMELAIPAGEITPVRLGESVQLGWTSWMAPNWAKTDETIRTDARFHVVSRIAQQRRGARAN